MVKIIFGCLILALGLWGCDEGGGGSTICFLPNEFPEFEECPADAFMKGRVCPANSLEIEGFNPEKVSLRLSFNDCEFPDCFTMDCEFREQDRDTGELTTIHNGVFSDLENYPGPGLVSVDGGNPVEYTLIPLIP